MADFASGLTPPYYAVIFANRVRPAHDGYEATAERMVTLAAEMPGFLGLESTRGEDGFGITISYWESEEAIAAWKARGEHLVAQQMGIAAWYEHYELRVARVERAYSGPQGRRVVTTPAGTCSHSDHDHKHDHNCTEDPHE